MSKAVFISLPMTDKTEEEIREKQDEAVFKLQKLYPGETFELLDTFITEVPDEKVKHDGAWFFRNLYFPYVLC